jgi:hypothetical protein
MQQFSRPPDSSGECRRELGSASWPYLGFGALGFCLLDLPARACELFGYEAGGGGLHRLHGWWIWRARVELARLYGKGFREYASFVGNE